jgi:hypothetical protein
MTDTARSRLTLEELASIERTSSTATASPWFSYVVGRDLEAGRNCIELGNLETIEIVGGTVADQDFIARAREDVPKLLREVRSLQAEVAAARAELLLARGRASFDDAGSTVSLAILGSSSHV